MTVSPLTWRLTCLLCLAHPKSSNAWLSPQKSALQSARLLNNVKPSVALSSANDENTWMEDTLKVGRNFLATATLSAVLWGSPDAILSPSHLWTPPSSYAESVLTEGSEPTAKLEGTVLDEAWTLVNKYYIDRWNSIHRRMTASLEIPGST